MTVEAPLVRALRALEAGQWPEARGLLLPLTRKPATRGAACYYLGVGYHRCGNNDEALSWLEHAVAHQPGEAVYHRDRGVVLKQLGRWPEAVAAYRQALTLQPAMVETLCNLGEALRLTGRLTEALACLDEAVSLAPGLPLAHYNRGVALLSAGDAPQAAQAFRRVLALQGDHFQAWFNLGVACQEMDQPLQAVYHYQQALHHQPGHADARRNLGNALLLCGRVAEALDHYRAILQRHPQDVATAIHRLTALLYQEGSSPQALFEEHRRFARRYGRLAPPGPVVARTPGEPLRVGYVSSNFSSHPVGMNLAPLLAHHDRQRFRLYLYDDGPQSAAGREWFRQQAHGWRPIQGLHDDQVARQVRQDGVQVLVILAGHFDGNRLLLAAQRPAPVCVSFHDGATSGLETMDYWLSDGVLHPADTREGFRETLWRLPVFYAYPMPEAAPEPLPPPVLTRKRVTFGSFNNPAKLGAGVLQRWGEILTAVPGAVLRLKYRRFFADPALVAFWQQRLQQAGIAGHQVEFTHGDPPEGHLADLRGVDIALDSFPFTGATTTFQCLWMGIPVVSLLGEGFIQRMAGSILHHAGLAELAATTPQGYVAAAVELAGDWPRLTRYHATLRQQVAASPLCQGATYAATVEEALEGMWRAKEMGCGK